MAIEIIKGDLLDAFDRGDVNVIGHVVNCQGVMGSGIAKTIKKRYPEVYEWYKCTVDDHDLFGTDPLGCVDVAPTGDGTNRAVLNIYAQRHYGLDKRHLNYAALAEGLRYISALNPEHKVIGFPYKLGSDRAGGDWQIVLEMIEYYLENHTVKIYQLEK